MGNILFNNGAPVTATMNQDRINSIKEDCQPQKEPIKPEEVTPGNVLPAGYYDEDDWLEESEGTSRPIRVKVLNINNQGRLPNDTFSQTMEKFDSFKPEVSVLT